MFEAAKRLLARRNAEQPPVTPADVAADLGVPISAVVEVVWGLAADHLHVRPRKEWAYAEILGTRADLVDVPDVV